MAPEHWVIFLVNTQHSRTETRAIEQVVDTNSLRLQAGGRKWTVTRHGHATSSWLSHERINDYRSDDLARKIKSHCLTAVEILYGVFLRDIER